MVSKQELLEAKENAIKLAIENINKGNLTNEYYSIITSEISKIEFEENKEKNLEYQKELSNTLSKLITYK